MKGCRPLNRQERKAVLAHAENSRERALKALFALADVLGNVATHSLRKTFAAEIYRLLDGKLEKVQVALGHRSITSTVAYLS